MSTFQNPVAIEDGNDSAVAWGAIVAGGIAAAALTLVLLALGAGLGFSIVSPWADSGVSATTFSWTAALYLIVVAMIASTIGGYMAGRLRTKWTGVHGDEVFFRDTAHGFMAWAFATVLSAAVLGGAATHLLAGATAGATQGAAVAAAQSAGPMDLYVDKLLRADPAANQAPADSAAVRSELGRLFASALKPGGDFSAADRTYTAQVVARRTGLSQADAEKRVTDVITEAKAAADTARKGAARLSLWLTLSLVLGAFSASLAAMEGGKLRDSRWYDRR